MAGQRLVSDIVHFVLGGISAYFPIIILFYFIYQALEKEDRVEKALDYMEFIMGFLMGIGFKLIYLNS